MENGQSIPYSLSNLQDRGKFFVDPNEAIYEGRVVGEHSRIKFSGEYYKDKKTN